MAGGCSLTMKHIRRGSAFDVYKRAIAQLQDDPDQFVFEILGFNGEMMPFNLPREQACLAGEVGISEGLMNAALVLKIGALLASGAPPSFRKEELVARPSASGTVRDALQWAFSGPSQTGWALMPLCTQGAWSLVVIKHGDADNGGCVISSGDGFSLMA